MSDTNTSELLKSLEALYLEGDYQQGIDLLLANKDIFSSGLYHYNLGTFYTRMGELGAGRYHLELSRQEGHLAPDLLNNISFIEHQLGSADLSQSLHMSDRLLNFFLSWPFQTYLFIALILTVVVLCLFVWLKPRGRLVRPYFLLCIVPLLPIGSYFFFDQHKLAIVIDASEILEGPSAIYRSDGQIQAGTKVIVGREYNGWHFIERPQVYKGWVSGESLGILAR